MPATTPETRTLTSEEQKSLTHGEFWIPEKERETYKLALQTLNRAGIRYVVSGLYAIHAYTGVYRQTKDLDLLLEPDVVLDAAKALKAAGFRVKLEDAHWLAKALMGDAQIDLIYGMANGLGFIDRPWYEHSRPGILAGTPVRVSPPEELIWHRLFIGERHRFDMADVVHLILHRGHDLDWERLLGRVGGDWRLLLSQLHFFDYVYPEHRGHIPDGVRVELQHRVARSLDGREDPAAEARTAARERRARLAQQGIEIPLPEAPPAPVSAEEDAATAGAPPSAPAAGAEGERPVCRGTLLSLFSFAIDVNEWGFQDERIQHVAELTATDVVRHIREAEVWHG
ncbi:MAG TPA: nucleotidyltransferase family protein [Longimicrobiales bacterium]|nr:nucleotidyltransferase family protein [Longimicrobiales bacterium]